MAVTYLTVVTLSGGNDPNTQHNSTLTYSDAVPTIGFVQGSGVWEGYLGLDDDKAISFVAGSGTDVLGTGASLNPLIRLTDTPSDFTSASFATFFVRFKSNSWVNDSRSLWVQLFASDGTTPLTNQMAVFSSITAVSQADQESSIGATGVVAGDKATWDGAVLQITHTASNLMGQDSAPAATHVDQVVISVTYTPALALTSAFQFFADDGTGPTNNTSLGVQDADITVVL